MDAHAFCDCVNHQDAATLVKIPGVGKKTAERLVLELSDKLSSFQSKDNAADQVNTSRPTLFAASAASEAESALLALGYKPIQATKAVSAAIKSAPNGSCEDLIRLSLKGMI